MTTQDPPELIEAMQQFEAEQAKIPPAKEIEYRLYHDATGRPLFMSTNEEPGSYIVISKAVYNKPNFNVMRVVNGELVYIDLDNNTMTLTLSETGYTSVKGHAGILADDQTTLETQTYGFKPN